MFCYYANLISDDVILFATKMWNILNKRYLWKYWSSVLETWHHKCTSQKKQNDTLSAVSIATLLAPVSFCQKAKIPICNLYGGTKGPTWNRNSSHIVFSPIIRLGGIVLVLKQNWELQFLLTQHQRPNCCHGNSTKGVILFLFWCTFVVPSFKNTASTFPEISFIQYFPLFSCKQYDVITDLICIIEKRRYL